MLRRFQGAKQSCSMQLVDKKFLRKQQCCDLLLDKTVHYKRFLLKHFLTLAKYFKYILNYKGFISHAALLFFAIFKTGIPVIYHVLHYLVVRAAASRPGSGTNSYGNKYFEVMQVLHSSVCCSKESEV
jgi:hypothetical protein